MHPDTEIQFINDELGYGVVATKFIPKGTITWVQDELDQIFTPEQVEKMQPVSKQMVDKYCFRNNKGNFVLCWDLAKYVNHSFKSNCLSTAYDFEIAIRNIYPGEQLTDDYGYLNVSEPFKAKDEGAGRTTVYPDDLLRYHKEWDEELENAFQVFNKVEQPLKFMLPPATQQKVDQLLLGQQQMDSILNLYSGK